MEISRLKPLYTREDIRKRVEQLGEQITKKYGDEPLVVVCVLKGAFIFFADLVRCIDNKNMIVDFVRLSSYGNGTADMLPFPVTWKSTSRGSMS